MFTIQKTTPLLFRNIFEDDYSDLRNWTDRVTLSLMEGKYSSPNANIIENDDELKIDMAIPGIPKEFINITVEDNSLTVKSEINAENKIDNTKFLRKEFYYGSFTRSFELPENIDSENIKSTHKDGVLSISLPKINKRITKQIIQIE